MLLTSVREQAYQEGLRAGVSKARDEALGTLEQAAQKLEAQREEWIEASAPLAVELARDIVRALLRVEIPNGRYDLEGIVRDALRSGSGDRSRCLVHLNPDDVALLEGVAFRSGTEVLADPDVPRGDVHLETRAGLLVREIDGGLEMIVERLLEDAGGS